MGARFRGNVGTTGPCRRDGLTLPYPVLWWLRMESPAGTPEQLAAAVTSRLDGEGRWHLSSDELIAALAVRPVEYWRALHALRGRLHFEDAVDGFSQDSVGELVTLAEQILGPAAEQALIRAGLFLPHDLRGQLIALLLQAAGDFSEAHQPDDTELASMLRYTGSVRRGIELYLEQHADLQAMIAESAAGFAAARGMAPAGSLTAARFLRELFSRHVMEKAALFAGLAGRLRLAAHRMGFADPGEQEPEGHAPPRARGRLAWARGVMGLPGGPIGSGELRRRYRELIMRFHPDVNPSGLERCKDITAAYALLAARAAGGGDG